MQAKLAEQVKTIGYLMTHEEESTEYHGALLVLSGNARPIEFHCSLPVRPKPAQKVLFGQTLRTFLLHEHIPQALLQKTKSKPDVLLVNDSAFLKNRAGLKVPMAMISESLQSGNPASGEYDSSSPEENLLMGELMIAEWGSFNVTVQKAFADDLEIAKNALECISRNVDIDEPFERVRIAMEETCKSVSNAA